jgi:hypothetical protein
MKIRLLFLIILAGCVNHDVRKPAKEFAMNSACERCNKTSSEMFWFQGLLDKAEDEEAWQGNVYAGELNGSVIFIHQPFLVSCVACHVYDCDGNRLTLTSDQLQLAAEQMTEQNSIYNSFDEQ